MFITFEGPEGCGKSTQSKKLKNHLEARGHKVLLTMEPGGTQVGKHIREILLDPTSVLDDATEVYLFAADRSEHVSKMIRPALDQGKIVLCDRYVDSTLAYQIGGRQLPEDLVRYLCMVSSKGLVPDLTILLDVPPQIGLKRAVKKGEADRFEKEKMLFHERVRAKYLQLANDDPERVKIIDSSQRTVDDIQEEIRKIVEGKLNEKR